MKKIPTLFVRDPDDRRYVTDEVTPGCEWVLAGEGVATRKYDGTCVLLDQEGGWWARREVKTGKTAPDGWWPADHDDVTGKSVGWEPIGGSPFAKFFDEAIRNVDPHHKPHKPGTYELIGPKINGNPEQADFHVLLHHADAERVGPTGIDFPSIRQAILALGDDGWEGIVWHHPDGRMAKLKRRDFPASTEDQP
jgi:hypothetical protein